MTDVTAVGQLIDGSLISRAVEPVAGEIGRDGHTHEINCLNCGAPLTGTYCAACGQHGHVHRTIGAFFHDLAHGVFHFEGKVWHTLPMLAWRPGELTRRYIDGQRARFVSPMALFLFSVFLMFAVVSLTGSLDPNFTDRKNLARAEQDKSRQLIKLNAERAVAVAKHETTEDFDRDIKETTDSLGVIRMLRGKGVTEADLTVQTSHVRTDLPWVEEAYHKAKQNPQLLIYKLKSSAYKWSWALIPLSVPFLWLLFPFNRRYRLYDHTVFVTYSLSFMSLLVVVLTAIAASGAPGVAFAALVVPPVHMYRQFKGCYSLGWKSALLRTLVLSIIAFVVLALFVVLMVVIGILD